MAVEPAPYAASAPPPPKHDPSAPALIVRASSGGAGLEVRMHAGGRGLPLQGSRQLHPAAATGHLLCLRA